jgi:hypothetical protein
MPLLTIPYSFASGEVIDHAKVNANFNAVATCLNGKNIEQPYIKDDRCKSVLALTRDSLSAVASEQSFRRVQFPAEGYWKVRTVTVSAYISAAATARVIIRRLNVDVSLDIGFTKLTGPAGGGYVEATISPNYTLSASDVIHVFYTTSAGTFGEASVCLWLSSLMSAT